MATLRIWLLLASAFLDLASADKFTEATSLDSLADCIAYLPLHAFETRDCSDSNTFQDNTLTAWEYNKANIDGPDYTVKPLEFASTDNSYPKWQSVKINPEYYFWFTYLKDHVDKAPVSVPFHIDGDAPSATINPGFARPSRYPRPTVASDAEIATADDKLIQMGPLPELLWSKAGSDSSYGDSDSFDPKKTNCFNISPDDDKDNPVVTFGNNDDKNTSFIFLAFGPPVADEKFMCIRNTFSYQDPHTTTCRNMTTVPNPVESDYPETDCENVQFP